MPTWHVGTATNMLFFSFAFRHVDAASFFSFAFRSHIAKSNALRESSCRLQSLAGEVAWQENRCENFHNLQCLRSCVSLLGYVLLVACGFLAAHSWRAGGGARMNPERTSQRQSCNLLGFIDEFSLEGTIARKELERMRPATSQQGYNKFAANKLTICTSAAAKHQHFLPGNTQFPFGPVQLFDRIVKVLK